MCIVGSVVHMFMFMYLEFECECCKSVSISLLAVVVSGGCKASCDVLWRSVKASIVGVDMTNVCITTCSGGRQTGLQL